MRTTIDIPDQLMKKAKIKAVKEGISLKEFFIRSLEKELSGKPAASVSAPWKALQGKGSASELTAESSGFEDYAGPDWDHSVQVNEPNES